MASPIAERPMTAGTTYRSSRSMPVDQNSVLATLLRGIADRDRVAFAELYATLAPALWHEVVNRGLSAADAEVVLATTFVEVWQLASFQVDSDTPVVDWIQASVRRRCAERRHRLRESGPDSRGAGAEIAWWQQTAVNYDESAKRAIQELLGGRAPVGRELASPTPVSPPKDGPPTAAAPCVGGGNPPAACRPRRVDLGAASAFGHRAAGTGPGEPMR